MKCLVRVGRKHHSINTKKYGAPRFAVYWAGRRFVYPGVHVWNGNRNYRVLPLRLR